MLTWLWELAQPVLEGVAATAAPYGASGVEKRKRLRAQLNRELAKPPGQQDAEFIRRTRMAYLSLSARASQSIARELEEKAASLKARVKDARSEISEYAAAEACCAAATWVDLRDAASCTALADYERQASYQGFTEWNALLERESARLQVPTLQLELSEELQNPPPRTDMCRACAMRLEQMEYKEGLARALQHDREAEYRRAGMLAPAPPTACGSSGSCEEPATGVPSGAAAGGSGDGQAQQPAAAEQQVQEAQQPAAAEHPQKPLPPVEQQEGAGTAPVTPNWQQDQQAPAGSASDEQEHGHGSCGGEGQAPGLERTAQQQQAPAWHQDSL